MEPGPSTVRARCPNPWIIREFPITFLLALVTSHIQFSSVQFSHSLMSDPLWPHGLQYARPPCSSSTPRVYSCPLSQWCHLTISSSVIPLLLLPSVFPRIRVFSNESVLCIRWPKHWSFSFSISPSNEYSALISCKMDWLDLLAVQGTLKSLLQHQSESINSLVLCLLLWYNSHIRTWLLERP